MNPADRENIEFIFSDNEFDVLEKSLITLESSEEVFKSLSNYLIHQFRCSFVFFYTDARNTGRQFCFFYPSDSFVDRNAVIAERSDSGISPAALFTHRNGSISVPFYFADNVPGVLFVGSSLNGKSYTVEEKRKLIPVVRILNKALLYVDSVHTRIEKRRLQYAFSKYVSPELVTSILEHDEEIQPGGRKDVLSVIFTDLQGFTTLSDTMEPEKLVRILNMYLNEMSQVIAALGGTIDKYEGDAIMAFFGAPARMEDHAVRCCLSALRMRRMEALLNEQLLHEKLIEAPLVTRFGINSGLMIVGNIGSVQRLNYTIIGSNVNIAARLESSNKLYNTHILMSEYTYELVSPYFECRYVDTAVLKGVKTPVGVYELTGEKKDALPVYENFLHPGNFPGGADAVLEVLE
jgi:class 3 adenylate cyclase